MWPLTGRTHQLRAHCAALGTPILGDGKYGGAKAHLNIGTTGKRLMLLARSITIRAPGGREVTITAPVPAHMAAAFEALRDFSLGLWSAAGVNQAQAAEAAPLRPDLPMYSIT